MHLGGTFKAPQSCGTLHCILHYYLQSCMRFMPVPLTLSLIQATLNMPYPCSISFHLTHGAMSQAASLDVLMKASSVPTCVCARACVRVFAPHHVHHTVQCRAHTPTWMTAAVADGSKCSSVTRALAALIESPAPQQGSQAWPMDLWA